MYHAYDNQKYDNQSSSILIDPSIMNMSNLLMLEPTFQNSNQVSYTPVANQVLLGRAQVARVTIFPSIKHELNHWATGPEHTVWSHVVQHCLLQVAISTKSDVMRRDHLPFQNCILLENLVGFQNWKFLFKNLTLVSWRVKTDVTEPQHHSEILYLHCVPLLSWAMGRIEVMQSWGYAKLQ